MPRDSSGNCQTDPNLNPVASGETIASDWANTTLDDIAAMLTDSLSRSGFGGMSAPLRGPNGTANDPTFSFLQETQTGRYLANTNEVVEVIAGQPIVRFVPTGIEQWVNSAWVKITQQDAYSVSYDPLLAPSNLAATNVQDAIDEVAASVDVLGDEYVTIDTAQTITGAKRFTQPIDDQWGRSMVRNTGLITYVGDVQSSTHIMADDVNGVKVDYGSGTKTAYHEGNLTTAVLNIICPVGCPMFGTPDGANPSTRFPGTTWTPVEGRVIVGADGTIGAGDTGGEAEVTLDVTQIPEHAHESGAFQKTVGDTGGENVIQVSNYSATTGYLTEAVGGGLPHNNMQPYLGAFIWLRAS